MKFSQAILNKKANANDILKIYSNLLALRNKVSYMNDKHTPTNLMEISRDIEDIAKELEVIYHNYPSNNE